MVTDVFQSKIKRNESEVNFRMKRKERLIFKLRKKKFKFSTIKLKKRAKFIRVKCDFYFKQVIVKRFNSV